MSANAGYVPACRSSRVVHEPATRVRVVTQIEFDESVAKQLEVLYATRDVRRRRALVREALNAASGERIVDVGCGPGFYVAELLDAVGRDGSIVGVDGSAEMLAIARRRVEGEPNVAFHAADATALPLEDGEFDAAFSVQVLEYVPDVAKALGEMHRVLRAGGRVVIWDVDWTTVSWQSSDLGRMQRILQAWDEHLAHPALPRRLAAEMRAAGFDNVSAAGHVFATTELKLDAYGGAIVPVLKQFVASRGQIPEDELEAWEADLRQLDERGEYFFACVQFCFTGSKPG
jgi:arsenite methyltransferase